MLSRSHTPVQYLSSSLIRHQNAPDRRGTCVWVFFSERAPPLQRCLLKSLALSSLFAFVECYVLMRRVTSCREIADHTAGSTPQTRKHTHKRETAGNRIGFSLSSPAGWTPLLGASAYSCGRGALRSEPRMERAFEVVRVPCRQHSGRDTGGR